MGSGELPTACFPDGVQREKVAVVPTSQRRCRCFVARHISLSYAHFASITVGLNGVVSASESGFLFVPHFKHKADSKVSLNETLTYFRVDDVRLVPASIQAHVSSWPLGLALLEELQGGVVGMLLSMCTSESHLSVWG